MMIGCAQCNSNLSVSRSHSSVSCPYCGYVTMVGHRRHPFAMPAPAYPAFASHASYPFAAYGMMQPQCSRAEYVLLGLFLGIFGVHNFAAGRTGAGAAQLLITLLTGWLILPLLAVMLWVVIEMIAVDTDGNGRQMS